MQQTAPPALAQRSGGKHAGSQVAFRSGAVDPQSAPLAEFSLLAYAIGVDHLIGWDSPARNWVVVVVLCMPLFFAGLIFARHIAERGQACVALGSNMLGAVGGGVLEYGSMLWGLRALYLVAAGLYALSWMFRLVQQRGWAQHETPIADYADPIRSHGF